MSVRALTLAPEPVLRLEAKPVTRFTPQLRALARDMIDTMYAYDGIGLAAPQVGESLQFFVANITEQRGRELVIANPVLESQAGRAEVVEGCLSLPKLWHRVKRSARITLSGQDLEGQPVRLDNVEGLLAIVLQHEVDHLLGRLFIDRLSWFQRRRLGLRARGLACA